MGAGEDLSGPRKAPPVGSTFAQAFSQSSRVAAADDDEPLMRRRRARAQVAKEEPLPAGVIGPDAFGAYDLGSS